MRTSLAAGPTAGRVASAVETVGGAAQAGVGELAWVGLITAVGLFVRLVYVLAASFPLNDGGLFLLMTRDLQAAGYCLPAFTSYLNGARIPFAYPPLPFYLAGAVADLTRIELLDVLRWLPLVASTLTIPAMYLLARALLNSRLAGAIAAFAFAAAPAAFDWQISGGGLTRAPGYLFAILALHQVHALYTRRRPRLVLSSAVCCALTALCHPEAAYFLALSCAVFFVCNGRTWLAVRDSALVAIGVLVLTAPWWATVIAHHGLAPLLAASGAGGYPALSPAFLVRIDIAGEPLLTLLAVLGLLGALVCLAERRWFAPAWLLTVRLLDPRSGPGYAMAPLAMLVAVCIVSLIVPRLAASGGQGRPAADRLSLQGWQIRLPLGVLAFYTIFGGVIAGYRHPELSALSPATRAAMQWAAATPGDAAFAVVTGVKSASLDAASEWFPALSGRTSVATMQGYEWLGARRMLELTDRHQALQECATAVAACVDRWAERKQVSFTHIFVLKDGTSGDPDGRDCCAALRNSLLASPDYVVVYDGPGASVYARGRRAADEPGLAPAAHAEPSRADLRLCTLMYEHRRLAVSAAALCRLWLQAQVRVIRPAERAPMRGAVGYAG